MHVPTDVTNLSKSGRTIDGPSYSAARFVSAVMSSSSASASASPPQLPASARPPSLRPAPLSCWPGRPAWSWALWISAVAGGAWLAGPAWALRSLLLAPWVEEVLFRAGLQRTLARRLPGTAAVAITAAVFALAHLSVAAALPGPLDPLLGGMALATAAPAWWIGRLYQRTGRLGPCVAAHALANLALLGLAPPASAADLARGQRLYDQHCLSCHGPAETPINATSLNARNLGPVLVEGIANARSGMLFLGDLLSASDIDDIAAFLGNTPGAITFPAQALDEAAAVRSVLVRAGRENMGRLSVAVQGDFTRVGGSCGSALTANTACTVDIAFLPRSQGIRDGVVLIAHDGLATPARIPVSGTGAPAVRGVLGSGSTGLGFGAQTVGGADVVQSLEIDNRGSAPLTLAPIRFTGLAAADFRQSGGTCATGLVLAAGARCTLEVAFRPTTSGPRSATLALAASDGPSTLSLALDGRGQSRPAPLLVLDLPRLDFGLQNVGEASTPREVLARNAGSAPLNWISLVASTAFTWQGDCAGTLAPGAICRLVLRFTPAALGPARGELVLLTDSEGGTVQLPLTGEGVRAVPQLGWMPDRGVLDLGTAPVGRAVQSEGVVLFNPGPDAVTLQTFSIEGSQAAEFSVATASSCRTGQTLAAAQQCTLAFDFLPRATGLREARLSVSASGEAPQVLRLTGNGQSTAAVATNLGSGGCTLGQRHAAFDPVWPLLVLAALAVLAWRRRQDAASTSARAPTPR